MAEIDTAPSLNAVSRDKKSASVRQPLSYVTNAHKKQRHVGELSFTTVNLSCINLFAIHSLSPHREELYHDLNMAGR